MHTLEKTIAHKESNHTLPSCDSLSSPCKCSDSLSAEEGFFVGYASVKGNLDCVNDVILPKAFQESLYHWIQEKKSFPPLCREHDEKSIVGLIYDAYEDEHGLYIKGRLFLQDQGSREFYQKLKEKTYGLSIGYNVLDFKEEQGIRYLKKIHLVEISIVENACNADSKIKEMKKETFNRQGSPPADENDWVETEKVIQYWTQQLKSSLDPIKVKG